jgi:hypothetical protein
MGKDLIAGMTEGIFFPSGRAVKYIAFSSAFYKCLKKFTSSDWA